MPPAKKDKPSAKDKQQKAPSFEAALEELEAMVETMESGQLPLEELISSYERGAKLIGHCESVLADARKRLELIVLEPGSGQGGDKMDSDDNSNQEDAQEDSSSPDDHNDDEIKLF